MKKIISLFVVVISLSACVHKMDVEQGNILTQDNINSLHKGMTKEQVKNQMGTPMLINTFDDHRIDYVYTFKPGYGKFIEKQLALTFQNNRLQTIHQG